MPTIVFHTNKTPQQMADERLLANLKLTPEQRMKKAFDLMALAALFKKGPIKKPEGKGFVLTKAKQ